MKIKHMNNTKGLPGSQVHFGQKSRPRASVRPDRSVAGTTFYFNAVGFVPYTKVQVQVADGQNKIRLFMTAVADHNGSIGHARISLSTVGLPPGTYQLKITGSDNKQKADEQFYVVQEEVAISILNSGR